MNRRENHTSLIEENQLQVYENVLPESQFYELNKKFYERSLRLLKKSSKEVWSRACITTLYNFYISDADQKKRCQSDNLENHEF